MSVRSEQYKKVCQILDDVLANRPSERDALIIAVQKAFDALTDDGWIPCEKRLPEDDTEVFVYLFDRQSPYIAWLTDCHWYTEDFEVDKENEPLAWMPLPKPYEPKEGI